MCCCVPLHKKAVLLLGDQRFHRALHVRMALEIPPFRPTPRCCPPKRVSHQSIVIPLLQCNLGCCEGRKRSQNSAERHATTTQVAGRPGGSAVGGGGWRRGRCTVFLAYYYCLRKHLGVGGRVLCIIQSGVFFRIICISRRTPTPEPPPAIRRRRQKKKPGKRTPGQRQHPATPMIRYNTSPRGARRINTRARCISYTCPLYSGAFQTPRSQKNIYP